MIKFLFCTVLHPGASNVDQTNKFDDFLDLTQFFQIWPCQLNDVNNVVYNFEYRDPEGAPFSL